MSFDNVYESLTGDNDTRWAFGTGFEDPLSGVDTTVPSGMDGAELAGHCLMLGDDALIFSHRLQEWCANAPELEEEVAIANIALDLLGQARLLLTRAGKADGTGCGEDDYAFLREAHEFRNVRLAELERGDFGELIARLLVFSTWRLALFQHLLDSKDGVLAAIAAKGVKELAYHRDYAARWAVRLGDGTAYSHERMQAGLDTIWPYVDELFFDTPVSREEFDEVLAQVLSAATLTVPKAPARSGVAGLTGRDGVHTEAMGELLAELWSVARAHPGGDLVNARTVAERVTDPELPMLTLADLGVLREVSEKDGRVVVSITPTYTGCPAMNTMRDDLVYALSEAGYPEVDVRTVLSPAWSTDWISETGRRKLADAGIAPPGTAPRGPVRLSLEPPATRIPCPRCGSPQTELVSDFGPTPCTSLRRCRACAEPFEHVKEI